MNHNQIINCQIIIYKTNIFLHTITYNYFLNSDQQEVFSSIRFWGSLMREKLLSCWDECVGAIEADWEEVCRQVNFLSALLHSLEWQKFWPELPEEHKSCSSLTLTGGIWAWWREHHRKSYWGLFRFNAISAACCQIMF